MPDKLINLWESSAIIQGSLALMFGATVCYLAIVGREPHPVLIATLGLIVGFYFGTKKRQQED